MVCASEETRPLSGAEARTFLEVACGNRFESLYVLATTAGLRRGELLELRCDDANLVRSTLCVGRSLVRECGRYAVGETRTKRGRRQVIRTSRTGATLKVHRKSQFEGKIKFAGLREDRGLIFALQPSGAGRDGLDQGICGVHLGGRRDQYPALYRREDIVEHGDERSVGEERDGV